jgi:hypothetical protein
VNQKVHTFWIPVFGNEKKGPPPPSESLYLDCVLIKMSTYVASNVWATGLVQYLKPASNLMDLNMSDGVNK